MDVTMMKVMGYKCKKMVVDGLSKDPQIIVGPLEGFKNIELNSVKDNNFFYDK